ncbi:hypothetical protein HanLR1_Chr16g0627751 [Helianthus annuus]|nr:hypothetical protein HanHA89_Chr16g0668061 [Helianthus annuus]KAJ0641483.1 hypothetical protein HanLR1_Chr16g0627751 [Helianthus annuus]
MTLITPGTKSANENLLLPHISFIIINKNTWFTIPFIKEYKFNKSNWYILFCSHLHHRSTNPTPLQAPQNMRTMFPLQDSSRND